MTRLEEKRRFDIWEGQRVLARAVRHLANRAATYSLLFPEMLVMPAKPEAEAGQIINRLLRELLADRRRISRSIRKRRRAA